MGPGTSGYSEFYFLGISSLRGTGVLWFLAGVSIGIAYLLIAWSLLDRINSRLWNWVVLVLVSLIGVLLAVFLLVLARLSLLIFGVSGEYIRFEADDGRAVLVNVSGMRDPSASLYTQVDAFHYVRRQGGQEFGIRPDIGPGQCDLTSEGELLLLTCGSDVVEIDPR